MTDSIDDCRRGRRVRRFLAAGFVFTLVVLGLSVVLVQSDATNASAATVSFSQCNGREAGIGGAAISLECSVSIVNTIDANGATSTVVYLRTCANNACTGDIVNNADVVNAVHQCNNSDNAGDSTTTCSVDIVNNISAHAPAAATALTLDQCNGSGQGGGAQMDACIASSQGSASVHQCNGSGNGGGATMTCTASGTTSTAFPVTVDQCNGSENGGGSVVICTTTITTNVFDTDTGPSGPPSGSTEVGGTPSTGTGTGSGSGSGTGSGTPALGLTPPVSPPVVLPPNFTG